MTNIAKQEPQGWGQILSAQKKQIAAALPSHMDANRLLRVMMTEIRGNKNLSNCKPESIISAMIMCAQLGVEPGTMLGHAYLIPYKDECQLIIGYRGMIDLARRSGAISTLTAHEIYSNDEFEFEYGLEEKLRHVPSKGNRGEFIGAYALAKMKDGGYQFEVMFKNEIDKIRSTSKAAKSSYSPWNTAYDEMAKKTVIRRLFKYLPVSIEIQKAVTFDEAGDRGAQGDFHVYEGESTEVEEPAPKAKITMAEKVSEAVGVDLSEAPF